MHEEFAKSKRLGPIRAIIGWTWGLNGSFFEQDMKSLEPSAGPSWGPKRQHVVCGALHFVNALNTPKHTEAAWGKN